MKFINISSGSTLDAAYVDFERQRFWLKDQLTKAGVPDARKRGIPIGVNLSRNKTLDNSTTYDFFGEWVALDPETETGANPLREKLGQLNKEYKAARLELLKHYYTAQKPVTKNA